MVTHIPDTLHQTKTPGTDTTARTDSAYTTAPRNSSTTGAMPARLLARSAGFGTCCLLAAAALFAPRQAQADYLQTIPGPDATGGMVMPMVTLNFTAQTVSVHMPQSNTVTMYPLQQYRVNGSQPFANSVFDPALASEPWYDLLDPTRQHLPFSTQFGFALMSANAHLLPLGSYVYLKATQISDGLKIHDAGYWASLWEEQSGFANWLQIFGEGNFGSTLAPEMGLDNVAAWGDAESLKMWHPIVLADAPGLYSARFEIYVGDAYAVPLQGWGSTNIELHWVAAVPEPAATAAALAAAMGAVALAYRCRQINRRWQSARNQ